MAEVQVVLTCVTFNDFPASVTSLAYNDAYYEVSDVGDSTAWEMHF